MQFSECVFHRTINECVENRRLDILTNFLWEIIGVLSQRFATVPSCAYASCQSEKVQMLLVPGGLVNTGSHLPVILSAWHLHLYGSLFAPVVDLLGVTSSP